jgi:hypothetical protein
MNKIGIDDRPLFRVEGKASGTFQQATSGDPQPSLPTSTEEGTVQKWPSVIPNTVNVEKEYSVFPSLRRGATSHTPNTEIPREVIEANNRVAQRVSSQWIDAGHVDDGAIFGCKGKCAIVDPFC